MFCLNSYFRQPVFPVLESEILCFDEKGITGAY